MQTKNPLLSGIIVLINLGASLAFAGGSYVPEQADLANQRNLFNKKRITAPE